MGWLGAGGSAALAAPAPSTPPGAAGAGGPATVVCTIKDKNLIELSGMSATADGYVVNNDSTTVNARNKVFFLNKSCQTVDSVSYGPNPSDPEDLAVAKDGTIWVADIGDNPLNHTRRSNIALWKISAAHTGTAVIYRMKYPDGPHDAEALLLDANDQPIIVTKSGKSVGDPVGLYKPTGPLVPNTAQGVPLTKVGEFKPQRTNTSNINGLLGQIQVTGGANSPDRKKVALRTYSDAYEWQVPDGDVVKAITTGTPLVTPLPDEPQGEAISYTPDGASFLTVSETADKPANVVPQILQYAPATTLQPSPPAATAPKNTLAWYQRLSLTQATWLIAGVGLVGAALVAAGVIGIVVKRKARAHADDADGARSGPGGDADAAPVLAGAGGAYVSGAYQAQRDDGSGRRGQVYPGQADGRQRSTTYGGGGGTQYGGDEYGGAEYGGGDYQGGDYRGTQYGGEREYSGTEYGGNEYGGNEYGGNEYGGNEYGGDYRGGEYQGNEYGGDYRDRPHDPRGYS